MLYKISIGDRWDDGHGRYNDFFIESSSTSQDIYNAYKFGSKILGFDLLEEECKDYDNSELSRKAFDALVDAVYEFTTEDDVTRGDYEEYSWLEPTSYLDILLFVLRLGGVKAEVVEEEATSLNFNGGYGLFRG